MEITTAIVEVGRTVRYAVGSWGRTVRLIAIVTAIVLLVAALR